MADWTGRSGGNALGWKLVVAVLSILGRRFAYGVATLVAAFYLLKGPSAGLRAYFKRVLPEVPVRTATWRLYRNFAIALIDRLAFLLKGPMQFRYRYEGLEHLREVFSRPGGAILLSSHHGNIEIIHSGTGKSDKVRRVKILRFEAQGDHGRAIFSQLPDTWKPEVIAVNGTEGFSTLSVLRSLRDDSIIAMHADRMMDDRSVEVDFFGSPVELPSGPWLLAALARVPVVEVECRKVDRDLCEVTIRAPYEVQLDRSRPRADQLRDYAAAWAKRLEDSVRKSPYEWYNFHPFWKEPPSA
jgi:predicted LPLAT superfamily acyltransferase